MSAVPAESMSRPTTFSSRGLAAAVLILTCTISGAPAQAQTSEQSLPPGQVAAVLKLQEVDFTYRSSVVQLSCSELQGGVSVILRALGARDDIQVRVTGCDGLVTPLDQPQDEWGRPTDRGRPAYDPWRSSSPTMSGSSRTANREQSSQIRVRLMMPVEATPAVVAQLEKDKSRRELVSRVTGNAAVGLNDPIIFPAQRQLVKLSRKTIKLEPEHCQLLEQMSTSVFRRLNLRLVQRGHSCSRDQVSRLAPEVTVEALLPVFPRAPQIAPAGDEPDPAASEDRTKAPENTNSTPPE